MDITPNTTQYMIAGYAVFSTVVVLYLVSLYTRWQRLQRDLLSLEEMGKDMS